MLSVAPIWAVALRHIRVLKRDPNALLAGFYWPLLDILVWGFLGAWIQKSQATQFNNFEVTALMGILLWQVVGRGSNFMANGLNEELWSNNVVNLFSLPLRTAEWVAGISLFYGIMMLCTAFFCMGVMHFLYAISIWYALSTFLIFLPPLFFSGLWLGFICITIVITLGKRGTELGYVVTWFLLPFSGAYYPIEILPAWGRVLSSHLPMSYVFQGMREYLMHQQDPTPYLIKGYALSIPYALVSLIIFLYFFNRSKQKGLARLAD